MKIKIIIEYSQTKRVINGPFSICGERATLLSIAEQIRQQVSGQDDDRFYSGWIQIRESLPILSDTKPVEWDVSGPSPSSEFGSPEGA